MSTKENLELLVAACEDDIREATRLIAQADRDGNPVEWARGQRDLADAQLRAQQCQANVMGPQQKAMWPWENPAWHNLKPEQQEGVAKQMLTPDQLDAAKTCGVDPITYAKNAVRLAEEKSKGSYPDRQVR